jgi:hypothetical protein
VFKEKPAHAELLNPFDVASIDEVHGNAKDPGILERLKNLVGKHIRINAAGAQDGVEFWFGLFGNDDAGFG